MITMQSIFMRHCPDAPFTSGISALSDKELIDINYNTLTAPGFGTVSLINTTIALAKEVMRLQRIIDNATLATSALHAAATSSTPKAKP